MSTQRCDVARAGRAPGGVAWFLGLGMVVGHRVVVVASGWAHQARIDSTLIGVRVFSQRPLGEPPVRAASDRWRYTVAGRSATTGTVPANDT